MLDKWVRRLTNFYGGKSCPETSLQDKHRRSRFNAAVVRRSRKRSTFRDRGRAAYMCFFCCVGLELTYFHSALAQAQPRLRLDLFDSLYKTFSNCRAVLSEFIELASRAPCSKAIPDQVEVLQFSIEYYICQAYRAVERRCEPAQIIRSKLSKSEWEVEKDDYFMQLQHLRSRSAEEAFGSARRALRLFRKAFDAGNYEAIEIFFPGQCCRMTCTA